MFVQVKPKNYIKCRSLIIGIWIQWTFFLLLVLPVHAMDFKFEIESGTGTLQSINQSSWILEQESQELVLSLDSLDSPFTGSLTILPDSPNASTRIEFYHPSQIEFKGLIQSSADLEIMSASPIHIVKDASLEAGNLKVSSLRIDLEGHLKASGGQLELNADTVVLDEGIVDASRSGGQGGTVKVQGHHWVSLGGKVFAGGSEGGRIEVVAGGLNIAGSLLAQGESDSGGQIEINVKKNSWENSSARLDVSGKTGGRIRYIGAQQILSSGKYLAVGFEREGGTVDVTAPIMKFLSAEVNADGQSGGGTIRLGGELQGGKGLVNDELPNAQTVALNDGTRLSADTLGPSGPGGHLVVWSEKKSTVLAKLSARPGIISGKGGFIETSSADRLVFAGTTLTGRGERAGEFLMDPKNIIIEDPTQVNQQAIILGSGYGGLNIGSQALGDSDQFGSAISLDGNRMAVGAIGDDGFGDPGAVNQSGSVYLFSFTGNNFSGGSLEGTIGSGYSGNKNIDQSLDANDSFGSSVSLDGQRLAVGAGLDDASGNSGDGEGAVYLYSFTDSNFTGGNLEAIIGSGYSGSKDIDQALGASDHFGTSVSLNGNRLAVGAPGDDGSGNPGSSNDAGALYFFSFTDSSFSGGHLEAIFGSGYSSGNNQNLTLDPSDELGTSVSMEGNRVVAGAVGDDASGNSGDREGAVYLLSFSDSAFSGGTLEGRIGSGYTGGKNIDPGLEAIDRFGISVSLDGTRLAVGASRDDGQAGILMDAGQVFLFNFSDSNFSSGSVEAIIGSGYTSGKNFDQTLEQSDTFGTAVSLDGNRLAVGATGDDASGSPGTADDSGAVYLYLFSDEVFSDGRLEATLGSGYSGGKNLSVSLGSSDLFGSSVSLDGNRLAVGVSDDDGSGNSTSDGGAVYLYSFSDSEFTGGSLEAIIGADYAGGKNLNQALDNLDNFGSAVSLDGMRLAVGAPSDRGSGNGGFNTGAVYLYTFTDTVFSNASLASTIGLDYAGANDVDQSLDSNDFFGSSVSLDGTRLAVGSTGDSGSGNAVASSGAVYLFTFSDSSFSGGSLEGTIGSDYTGGNNINQSLDASDGFGQSVSLDGTRLAVGSTGDSGSGNALSTSGAVYLYTFTDTSFSDGSLQATLGSGYSGGKNFDQTLDSGDFFGQSVSLDGIRLAVGARQDDGLDNPGDIDNSGAVYLYTFSDTVFSGGTLAAVVGSGYEGEKNVNQPLDNSDFFGKSVSLDGNRLAVGAEQDDRFNNSGSREGAVYLYRFSDDVFSPLLPDPDSISQASSFASFPGKDASLSSVLLEQTLSSPTNVTLQANNDITLSSNLTVNNPSGAGGGLVLQAGRSIHLSANITTDDGSLTLIANELPGNGADSVFREIGAAEITMNNGTSINTGTGSLNIEMREGGNQAFTDCGNVNLQTIQSGAVTVDVACNSSSLNINQTVTAISVQLDADDDIIFTVDGDVTTTGSITINADSDSESDAGFGGALSMANGTLLNAGSGSISLSADEAVTLAQIMTTGSAGNVVSIASKSAGVVDAGTSETNVDATSGGLNVSTATDIGSGSNFIEGNVSSLDFSAVTRSDFFSNAGTIVGFDTATSNGAESATNVNIPVSLSQVNGTTTVDYSVSGGTATGSGTDFTLTDGTLTFNPGITTQNISFSVTNDVLEESDETVEVTLSNPHNATLGGLTVHTFTINDGEAATSVAFEASSSSGDESNTPVNIPVSLNSASLNTISVSYAVTGGSATGGGTDFTLANGTLTFNPSDTTKNIAIGIVEDALDESDETIEVTLSSPTNASLGATTVHTYTISDNDGIPTVGFQSESSSGTESDVSVQIPVVLSNTSASTITVDYSVSGGSATNTATDFALADASLTFNPGETAKNINVSITDDGKIEPDETIEISLSNPDNATLGIHTLHTYTIQDDDRAGVVDKLKVISPYWQADSETYTFISVSHPSLSQMSSRIGVQVEALLNSGTLLDNVLQFTIQPNETRKVFIVQSNHSFITPENLPDSLFVLAGSTASEHGQLEFSSVYTNALKLTGNPETSGRGYADITLLNYWGAVVVQATSTGFAMEFIGDNQDSRALNMPLFSGVN